MWELGAGVAAGPGRASQPRVLGTGPVQARGEQLPQGRTGHPSPRGAATVKDSGWTTCQHQDRGSARAVQAPSPRSLVY